jgi:hypothetical protein
MKLTARSRLGCIKSRQQRQQRKLEKLQRKSGLASDPASETESVSRQELTVQKKAWERYLFAKAVYEETREAEHWLYMQQCISDYEKTLESNVSMKAS